MSKEYSWTEALGVLFIFGSILPSLYSISIVSMLIVGSSITQLGLTSLDILLLVFPLLTVTTGLGLVQKRSWARGSSICLMLCGIIYVFCRYLYLDIPPTEFAVIILILVGLLCSNNQSHSTIEPDDDKWGK